MAKQFRKGDRVPWHPFQRNTSDKIEQKSGNGIGLSRRAEVDPEPSATYWLKGDKGGGGGETG